MDVEGMSKMTIDPLTLKLLEIYNTIANTTSH